MPRQRTNSDINAPPREAQAATEKREPKSCNIGASQERVDTSVQLISRLAGSAAGCDFNHTKPTYTEKRAAILQQRGREVLPARIYVGSSAENRVRDLGAAFDYIGFDTGLSTPRKGFVKTNFTFPIPVP